MVPPIWIMSVPLGYVNTLYPRALGAILMMKSGVPLDNANPREQVEGKEVTMKDTDGYTRRAIAAHKNGWESMNIWVAAIVLARVMGVDPDKMNTMATIWLGSRILYNPAYILIKSHTTSFIRSGIYFVGISCSFSLMWAAACKA